MAEKTIENKEKPKIFEFGGPGGPGRPPDTPETKIIKRAVKELVKEYEETLSDALPSLSPVLIAEAKKGNMKAFKEIHDVVGARKPTNNQVTAVQINFGADREEFQ